MKKEDLENMNHFALYKFTQDYGLSKELEQYKGKTPAEFIWEFLEPKNKENIFQELNNSQLEYIKAKEQMCQLIIQLEAIMVKIPKDFSTKYLDKNLQSCTKIKKELKDNNTEILVFGETSSGKSLFLNLLLGDMILTSTVLNCTSAITKINYNEKKSIRARKTNIEKLKDKEGKAYKDLDNDKKEEDINEEILEQVGTEKKGERKENKSKKIFEEEWIEKDLSKVEDVEGSIREFLKADRKDRDYPLYDLVQLNFDSKVLQNGITLIDSPGLNENENLTRMVLKYLPKTIGIVCIVNARQGVTLTVKEFFIKLSRLPNFSANQMFIVVSNWDAIENQKVGNEFIENMIFQVKQLLPSFDENNIVKVNLKAAFLAAKNGLENKDYLSLLENLIPFFKRAFKLKLQKQWIALKEVLRFSNSVIKMIYNKAQDSLENNTEQFNLIKQEMKQFEMDGENKFKEFDNFVRIKINDIRKQVRQIIFTEEVKEKIFFKISDMEVSKTEDSSTVLDAWLENTIRKTLINYISTNEQVISIFKKEQSATKNQASEVFGKILFCLDPFLMINRDYWGN
eukprot:TRINITY_DN5502_c0_g1_i1.p1 TRINITY_DN5502_c0_g1~~TRINITY_DN5502_c0_g1_i1.p1  ORF type:complete len:580 (+),score=158.36 TRINITY_DN5502_c0_g1_i1:34-1740(+)